MTLSRWIAGLAAMITAMLLQATLVGPLALPLPASLPLVLVIAVGVLSGPSAGISIGFAGGLLVDLGSSHTLGLLAFTWLAVGTLAGGLGGMVVHAQPLPARRTSSAATHAAHRSRREAGGRRGTARFALRREQALLVGLLGGFGSAVAVLARAGLNEATEPLASGLVRCAPGAVLDAILALAVLPIVAAALRSGSLRAAAPVDGLAGPVGLAGLDGLDGLDGRYDSRPSGPSAR